MKTVAAAKEIEALVPLADSTAAAADRLGAIAMHLGKTAMSPDFKTAFAHATPFMEVMGDLCMAWMLLWRATIAAEKLAGIAGDLTGEARAKKIARNKNAAFYDGQIQSANFFIDTILPVTMGKMNAIEKGSRAAIDILEPSFGG